MTDLVACPSCQTMNRPGQERCRACGRTLPKARGTAAPVGLQQVMGGEVFTAVVENGPRAPPTEVGPPAPDAVQTPEEETLQILAGIADRVRDRAASSGQRFKPYGSERLRSAERPEERKAVAQQLDSAASSFREKRYEDAIEHLLRAIAKDDRDPRSWTLLGEAYLRRDRPYKAAVGYLRALELERGNGNAWLGLARTLRALGCRFSYL